MTREEHLQWCKERALEYARRGDLKNAVASMGSDLKKHPDTENHTGVMLGILLLMNGMMRTGEDAEKWIDGFK